jgi:hypothetical protein
MEAREMSKSFDYKRLPSEILVNGFLLGIAGVALVLGVRFNDAYFPFLIRHFPVKSIDHSNGRLLLVHLQPMLPSEAAEVFKAKGWRPATIQELKEFEPEAGIGVATAILSDCEWMAKLEIQDCATPIKSRHGEIGLRSRVGFDWGDPSIRWLAVKER